jgi:hypothetical protein
MYICRTINTPYRILKHWNTRREVTADNGAYVVVEFFTQNVLYYNTLKSGTPYVGTLCIGISFPK